jgi:hypothetical protein
MHNTRAGYHVRDFLPLVGFSRTTLHLLPPELRPHSVRFGRRIIIIEEPVAYLARVAAAQAARPAAPRKAP